MKPQNHVMWIALLAAGAAFPAELFPLQDGNLWKYRDRATGLTLTVRAGSPVMLNGNVYHTLTGFTDAPVLARVNDQNELVAAGQETGQETLLASFHPDGARWWDAPARGCGHSGRTLEQRVPHEGPAGPLPDALELRFAAVGCGGGNLESEQYAENLGMVRRVVSSPDGRRHYDLVSAQVGKISVEASAHAMFSLSVADDPGEETLAVTLHLRLKPRSTLALHFPSSQEYDLAITDPAGRIVWKWSDGRFFSLFSHSLAVAGEWSATVRAPRPFRPGHEAEQYMLHAWLTAGRETPPFAASFPLAAGPAAGVTAAPRAAR